MSPAYKTIDNEGQGYFSDRKSKFYSFAFPVQSEEEVKKILKQLKKKYHDARHHVYAFRLGADKKKYRYSDDGEPANSSGFPVFGVIKSYDLTDILIVVVRYFGGKKLGIPGLINAYKTAAQEAIKNSKIIEKIPQIRKTISFSYPQMNKIMNSLKKINAKIIAQNFSDKCALTFEFDMDKKEIAEKLFKDFDKKIK